jgi:hypothetical protein
MRKSFLAVVAAVAACGTASAHATSHVVSSKALSIAIPEPSGFVQLAAGLLVLGAAAFIVRRFSSSVEVN